MSDDRVIPNAVISRPADPSGQASPAALTTAAQASASQQVLTAARDSVIPITYGGPDRVAGKLYIARTYQGVLLLCVILAEGPIQGVQNPALNDLALLLGQGPTANGVGGSTSIYSGTSTVTSLGTTTQGFPSGGQVAITTYLGSSTQGVDPTLAAAIPGFAAAMPGTAYAVITVPPAATTGFPRITFEILGRKVYDPRDVTQNAADPSTWKWSDNPALCLADFLSNQAFGASKSVDWTSATDAANYCDQVVTGTGGSEKRALLALTLAEKRNVREWIEVLRAYVPAWVDYAGGVATIVADQPRASDFTFTADTIDQEPRPQLRKRGRSNLPTVVRVGYMRTDVTPWAMDYAENSTGSTVRRIASIDMPGIRRYSQAKRFATERLNHYTLEAIEGTFGVFEDGLKVMLGDRATITDDLIGGTLETRIIGREDRGHGRWTIYVRKYDPAAYSSSVEIAASSPDTGRPDPSKILPPTNINIAETIYLERVNGSAIAGGLIWQERFDVTWTAPVHPYPLVYRVELWDGAPGGTGSVKIREEIATSTSYSTPPVQQGKSYTIRVFSKNSFFESATPLVGSQTAQGKLLPPGPVPNVVGQVLGGIVLLTWGAAADLDVVRYEWRYTPNVTAGGSWAVATMIDRVDGMTAKFHGLPVGTHRFYARAIDSVGNYSTTDATIDLSVTSDANSFLQSKTFTNPLIVSAEMVTNGGFSSAASWSMPSGISIAGGTLNVNVSIPSFAFQNVGAALGRIYKFEFDVSGYVSGSVTAGLFNNVHAPISANGHYVFLLVQTSATDTNAYVGTNNAGVASIDNLSVTEVSNLAAIPALEGVGSQRWETSVWGDQWSAVEPSPLNSGGNAIDSYRAAGTSFFRGEPWDLGTPITGDWSLTANEVDDSGAAAFALETSPDGSTWTAQPGISWKGSTRFIRPNISTAGSMTIKSPPKITLAAQSKSESGQLTTSAAAGALVQLVGQYAGAQDLQVTAINTSSPRFCVADRVLLHPQTGLMLYAECSGGGGGVVTYKLDAVGGAQRPIAAGDVLQYDVLIDPATPAAATFADGGMQVIFTDATGINAAVDADGYNAVQPAIGFDALARGQWKSRSISLAAFAGKTTDIAGNRAFRIRLDGTAAGTHKTLYRNVRITNGASTVLAIYSSGDPGAVLASISNYVNDKCGPSNSFLLYTFSDAGAQLAQLVQWSFKGF